jgi:hypothetical protein
MLSSALESTVKIEGRHSSSALNAPQASMTMRTQFHVA